MPMGLPHPAIYRLEVYENAAGARARRWWLKDSMGREHVAVDTTRWDTNKSEYVYEAVSQRVVWVGRVWVRRQVRVLWVGVCARVGWGGESCLP